MKTLSYKIHLPTGTHITARNAQELENILGLNVCRVYQSQQIRIEPVWERSESSSGKHGYTTDNKQVTCRIATA